MMKKIFTVIVSLCLSASIFGAELTAKFVTTEASKKDTVEESISYLKNQASKMTANTEKRSVYIFLASLQEQMALYDEAQKSYAAAAGIAAGDAEGMPRKSNEQIVLEAIRCALSCGDYATADSYLNSAVRNSKNPKIQAYIKLYTQWSALCRAETVNDLQEPIVMLQAYTKVESMNVIKPAVLLTLWYITGDVSYSKQISADFPASVEAAIVTGDVQLLPTPFWFFVPKSGEAEQGTGTYAVTSEPETVIADKTKAAAVNKVNSAVSAGDNSKISKWQLGLFRTESNAKLLAEEVKGKGFEAYITTETRSSGTTYYLVIVNEDKSGNIADKLRSSGYDCYAIE